MNWRIISFILGFLLAIVLIAGIIIALFTNGAERLRAAVDKDYYPIAQLSSDIQSEHYYVCEQSRTGNRIYKWLNCGYDSCVAGYFDEFGKVIGDCSGSCGPRSIDDMPIGVKSLSQEPPVDIAFCQATEEWFFNMKVDFE